jgi:eukaryotic-like serine/threonine-protein kinase
MNLDRASWERLQTHFDRLVELEPDQRAEELASLAISEGDRQLLDQLLRAHDDPDPLLESASAPDLLDLVDEDDHDAPVKIDWCGRTLGPWRVGEQIGRGGMSVIHSGFRADGQFEKTVAIKVLDAAQLASFQQHRLAEEVRILARLEHPGIARLIDSGTADDGHPYLVMEYVDGKALNVHARENRLGVRDCVQLIMQVARALGYAHQRQVIHCDVKPTNILVTPEGQVRVVDFGIAALIQRQAEPDRARNVYCSPAYAAPERLTGTLPTTRQDVFSLGAVLYQLLTGRSIRPRDALAGNATSEELTPPSQTASVAAGNGRPLAIDARQLRGDLDAICLKALNQDPDQRYGGMSELLADLEAWLERRPVLARQGGRGYIVRRWLQRHATASVLAVLLLTVLIGGAVIALEQARIATQEAARALAARDFLVGILEAADPTLEYGHDPTASELLRRGAEEIDERLANQPELRIDLLHIIGKTQLERGLIDDAVASLDRAISSLGDNTAHPVRPALLATRGMAAYEQGNYTASIEFLDQAHNAARRQSTNPGDRHSIDIQLADMLVVDSQAERALELTGSVLNEQLEPGLQAQALRVHGAALEMSDRLGEAERVLREAWTLQRQLDADHVTLAMIENDLGIVYWRQADLEQAAEQFEASWRHKQEIYGNDHPQTLTSLGNLAGVYSARGDHAAAESAYRESLAGLIRVHGDQAHPDVAYTHGMLGLTYYWQDDLNRAREAVAQARDMEPELSDTDHSMTAWLVGFDALLAMEQGEVIEPGKLGVTQESCLDFETRTALGQRLCLAWWLLTSESPNGCDHPPPHSIDPAILQAWPPRWQQNWRLTLDRCQLPLPEIMASGSTANPG